MHTSFERNRIRDLQKAVPHLAEPLKDLESRLIDLHPVIRDYVYHPDFHGSVSLREILHPLVPHHPLGRLRLLCAPHLADAEHIGRRQQAQRRCLEGQPASVVRPPVTNSTS